MSADHDWNIVVHYHKCPKCNFIIESRKDYHYRLGKYEKNVVCDRCHHAFKVESSQKPKFGPLIGKPQPPEFDWGAT